MHSRFSEAWAARPRLSKGLSAALIALQGLLCILSFAFLLNILANEDPWFNYGESAFEKGGSSTIRNLIIAAVVLTSLALVLLAMPAKDSNRSWRLVRGVSVLTLSCLVVLIAALALLRREFPAGVSVEARSSLFYLETALGLMAASVGCFALAILFGKDPELSAKARKLQVAMVLISFYLFFGGLIYRRLEDWKYDDAVMFSLVTITSIGYGNIAPSFTGSRVFTIFFALSGLIFVGFAIEQFRSLVVEDITSKLTKGLEKTADKQGDMVRISKAKRDRYIKRFAVVFVLLAWWLIGAAIFMDLEGWTYFEAFYFSFVTLSTIGYGDFYPKNGNAKTFLIFFTIVGLGAFAFGLSTLSETDEEELSEKMKSKLSVQEGTSTGPAAQPAPPLPVHDTQKLASLAVQMSSLFHSLSISKSEGERSDLLRKYLRMRQELDACFGPEAPAVSSV